jgi:hypothetical protein
MRVSLILCDMLKVVMLSVALAEWRHAECQYA